MISEIAIVGIACVLSHSTPQQETQILAQLSPTDAQAVLQVPKGAACLPDAIETILQRGTQDFEAGKLQPNAAGQPTNRCGDDLE